MLVEEALFCAARIRTTFVDSRGRETPVVGTGFWLRTNEKLPVFVTNKHNVDPRMKPGLGGQYRTKDIVIELREMVSASPQLYGPKTAFFRPRALAHALWIHETADVAMLAVKDWTEPYDSFRAPLGIEESDLADEECFRTKVDPMDLSSFIGFPGSKGQGWHDDDWTLAIARPAYIASRPSTPFVHREIKTADVLLVSGFSFAGSSGSPVWVGWRQRANENLSPQVIGIMSGHLQDGDEPDLLRHTGLSYLTRSTSILALIELARGARFTRAAPEDALA